MRFYSSTLLNLFTFVLKNFISFSCNLGWCRQWSQMILPGGPLCGDHIGKQVHCRWGWWLKLLWADCGNGGRLFQRWGGMRCYIWCSSPVRNQGHQGALFCRNLYCRRGPGKSFCFGRSTWQQGLFLQRYSCREESFGNLPMRPSAIRYACALSTDCLVRPVMLQRSCTNGNLTEMPTRDKR